MSQSGSYPDLSLKSPVFPGESLIAAVFDRDLMRLSDRGGASGLIGDRWSDICVRTMADWPGSTVQLLDEEVHVDRIVRLDAVPGIARMASRKKLQNPDYVVVGNVASGPVVLSADAKFSVETAGASQVSAESLRALLDIGPVLTDTVGLLAEDTTFTDGIFLSPDYSLTHFMMSRKKGYRSVSVDPSHITLLPITSLGFLKPMEASTLIPVYADIDGYGLEARRSLLLGLYYFRLVRAGIGCWYDETSPLLIPKQKPELDLIAVDARARELAQTAMSGWDVVKQWDTRAEAVRSQRDAVNEVTSIPIVNRELRAQLESAAGEVGMSELPSLNKVRRRIGTWFRDQLIAEFGPIVPPVDNFPRLLQGLGTKSQELRSELGRITNEIITQMLQEAGQPPEESGADAARS